LLKLIKLPEIIYLTYEVRELSKEVTNDTFLEHSRDDKEYYVYAWNRGSNVAHLILSVDVDVFDYYIELDRFIET
jgi:hypothetical protein